MHPKSYIARNLSKNKRKKARKLQDLQEKNSE